jgi:hypothetical protein
MVSKGKGCTNKNSCKHQEGKKGWKFQLGIQEEDGEENDYRFGSGGRFQLVLPVIIPPAFPTNFIAYFRWAQKGCLSGMCSVIPCMVIFFRLFNQLV